VEVITGPCAGLFELQAAHEAAMQRLLQAAAGLDYRVLGYGIQPLTPPTLDLISPKQRYLLLNQVMAGAWLWFTVTASDRCR
jgi:gamma-glutamylcysteine synthetase